MAENPLKKGKIRENNALDCCFGALNRNRTSNCQIGSTCVVQSLYLAVGYTLAHR